MKRVFIAIALVLLFVGCTEKKYFSLPTPPCPADTVTAPGDSTSCDYSCRHRCCQAHCHKHDGGGDCGP